MPAPILLSTVLSENLQDAMKWLFSGASLLVTVYFWCVRINRERVSLRIYSDSGFEGTLESGGVGLWVGRIFVANRSILPTAIIAANVELWWDGRWQSGRVIPCDGSELPWNMPPTQVFARGLRAVFDLGEETPRERIYATQRLRFTFSTVEGCRVRQEVETAAERALAA